MTRRYASGTSQAFLGGVLSAILEWELCILAAVAMGEATLQGKGLVAWTWAGFVAAVDWISRLQLRPPNGINKWGLQ